MPARPNLRMLLVLLCSALLASAHAKGFVQRTGAQLTVDGEPFYFLGADAYWLVDVATRGQRTVVDRFFQNANAYNLKVIRMWGLNHNSPNGPGSYNENEMKAFDYIIDSAGRHNIRLIFALGNTWRAYRSPEVMMRLAGVNPSGKTLLDFYGDETVKVFFKNHMRDFVNRVNTFTGVAYKDDPTIMLWDVFNEPRCPGCQSASQQQTVKSWLQDMSATLKSYAPKQLVAAGTEGYFMDDAHVRYNPGAGAQCEGEDWVALSQISSFDVNTAHVYDRQMEGVPPDFSRPTFEDLLHWFKAYIEQHISVSQASGKPYIIEEFNVLIQRYPDYQRAQVFQLVYDLVKSQKAVGGPLMGAMFWNAAIGNYASNDGYNVYLDVGPPVTASGRRLLAERQAIRTNDEGLDSFRRGPERGQCASAAAKWWTPIWRQSEYRTAPIASLQQRTAGKTTQDVIRSTQL